MARCCCVVQDRADIQYAEAWHARQRVIWRQVKRLGRCSEGRPRAIAKISCQQQPSPIDAFSDSDWAGCKLTARSTRGGATIMEHVSFSSCECVRCPVAGSTASRPPQVVRRGKRSFEIRFRLRGNVLRKSCVRPSTTFSTRRFWLRVRDTLYGPAIVRLAVRVAYSFGQECVHESGWKSPKTLCASGTSLGTRWQNSCEVCTGAKSSSTTKCCPELCCVEQGELETTVCWACAHGPVGIHAAVVPLKMTWRTTPAAPSSAPEATAVRDTSVAVTCCLLPPQPSFPRSEALNHMERSSDR